MYVVIKNLHMICALVSIAGFVIRSVLINLAAKKDGLRLIVNTPLFQVLPHFNDSLLLAAALYLAISAHINPFEQPWLLAKVVALLAYIGLGIQVIKRRGSKTRQAVCFVAALVCFAYIAMAAISKQVFPF